MIEKISKDILEKICLEFKKKENINKINECIINPLITHIFKQLYPYILATSIILFLTFIFAFIIFMCIIKSYSSIIKTNA
jgi:hypothetical protein